jgi:L-cysteine S-thiosulfotransferase
MAKSPIETFLCIAAIVMPAAAFWAGDASAAECKRKTAGFYLEDTEANRPHKLSSALEKLPASLTGARGDPEHGREVFISMEKGGCATCHQLSSLPRAIGQGSIGPVLDGTGSRYNEQQLRQVLLQPRAYFPETIMPSYYRAEGGDVSVLTASEIEDLVAYLGTLK